MLYKNQVWSFVFILFLLVISGCNGIGSGSQKSITDEDVRKGFDGLGMSFTKNAPPESVFEDSVFPVAMNLQNNGATDIEQGYLSLGLEKEYVDISDENRVLLTFMLKGRSVFNLEGDEEFIELKAESKRIGSQSETHPSTIFATACYSYKTVLGASTCIDPDLFGTELRDKACQAKDTEFKDGQGAPVAITKVETRMLPDKDTDEIKPHFIIHIENKGTGQVIVPEHDKIRDACTKESLNYADFNRMKIRAFLSGKELNCDLGQEDENEPDIVLREKKDVIRCTLEEGFPRNRDAFTALLMIELEYGYTFTISKDIIIEKILTY